jgi:hypothetical protein
MAMNQPGLGKMKATLAFVLLAGFLFIGCKKEETAAPANAAGQQPAGNPLTAPADYLGAAANAKKSADKTLLSASLDQAVKMFSAQEGRLPKDLNELVPQYLKSIPALPPGMKYSYDPRTGEVKVVPN